MNRKINLSWIVFLFLCTKVVAQTSVYAYVDSPMELVSVDSSGKALHFITQNSTLLLNPATLEFSLKANLATLHIVEQGLDTLIDRKAPQTMLYRGTLNEDMANFNRHVNDGKSYSISGSLLFNGKTIPCVAVYSAISLAERSDSKNYRVNFRLSVDETNFVIKGLESLFTDEVGLEISGGTLNIQQ